MDLQSPDKSKNKRAGSGTDKGAAGTACSTGHDLGQKYGEWEEYFEAAQEYYRQHGNLEVMAKYVTEEGLPLGRWLSDISNKVSDENLRRVSLTDEQLERLKSIGFKQEKKTARQWNEKYELAKNYYEIHGDLNVPLSYCVNDVKLGRWISNIRSKRKHPGSNGMALSQDRIRQLDSIGMNWK